MRASVTSRLVNGHAKMHGSRSVHEEKRGLDLCKMLWKEVHRHQCQLMKLTRVSFTNNYGIKKACAATPGDTESQTLALPPTTAGDVEAGATLTRGSGGLELLSVVEITLISSLRQRYVLYNGRAGMAGQDELRRYYGILWKIEWEAISD